jgi:hypothetical protein
VSGVARALTEAVPASEPLVDAVRATWALVDRGIARTCVRYLFRFEWIAALHPHAVSHIDERGAGLATGLYVSDVIVPDSLFEEAERRMRPIR